MKKLILTTILLLSPIWSNAAMADQPELRGHYEASIKPFHKWTGVMRQVPMAPSKGNVTGEAALEKMRDIHYGWYSKNYSYLGYDPKDHWKTPKEFARDKGGDCEDFAIADYYAGVKAGIPEDDMEIAVGTYLPTAEVHAVLRLRVGDDYYYFQGITTRAIPESDYQRLFIPFYGINRHHWEPAE